MCYRCVSNCIKKASCVSQPNFCHDHICAPRTICLRLTWFMDFTCDILKEWGKSNGKIKHFHFPEFHYPLLLISQFSPYQLKARSTSWRSNASKCNHAQICLSYPFYNTACVSVCVCDGWCFRLQLAYTWNHMKNVASRGNDGRINSYQPATLLLSGGDNAEGHGAMALRS